VAGSDMQVAVQQLYALTELLDRVFGIYCD
jgi:hypothetical protein